MTDYPNREHANADKAARRRALAALSVISSEADLLSARLDSGGIPDADAGRKFGELAVRLAAELAALETLRDVREWHAADVAMGTLPPLTATHEGRTIEARDNIPAGEPQ